MLIDIAHGMTKLYTNNKRQVCAQFRETKIVYIHNFTEENDI